MKVTKKDILQIRAGSSTKFWLPTYEACRSGANYAYTMTYSQSKPADVERYRASINPRESSLIIEAVRKE